jgi:drug/metabolite transporter (DMT)-like permease
MGLSIAAYSLFPLIGALSTQTLPPWLFIGLSHVVSFLTFACFVGASSGGLTRCKMALQATRKDPSLVWYLLLDGILNPISHFLLFFSFVHIAKTNATVIFETWPLFGMLGTTLLMKKHFERLSKRSFSLGVIALLGLALVVWAGQSDENDLGSSTSVTLGTLAAAGAAITMAISVSVHVKARIIVGTLPEMRNAALITNVLTKAISAVIFILVVILWQPWPAMAQIDLRLLLFILLNGAFIVSIGSITYSEALAVGGRSEVILLWYLTPLLAVIWLWLLGLGDITETLVLGGLFIISANVLLHARADDGPAYVAVFLTLCVAGTVLHLMPALPLQDFLPSASLIELISLPLGIFGILTGFVLGRKFARQQEQEETILDIVPCLLSNEMPHLEAALRAERQSDIDLHFVRLYRSAHERTPDLAIALRKFRVKLGRSVSHGELIVLWSLSVMTTLSVVFFRPNGVIGDMIVLLTVTSLTYLVMLMTMQSSPTLVEVSRRIADPMAPPMRSRIWDRRIAVLTIAAVFVAQIVLAFERDGFVDFFARL